MPRIMLAVELVEGEDRLNELELPSSTRKPIISLLLCLTKLLHDTEKVTILDSSFCALQGIIELCKKIDTCFG